MKTPANRYYILFAFAVVYGWVKALPYEGPVLYALAGNHGVSGSVLNSITVFCLFIGLFTGRFISTDLKEAKRTIILSTGGTLLISAFIPFVPDGLWYFIMPGIGFLMGTVLSGFAHLIVTYVPTTSRSIYGADMLIYSYVVLIIAHTLTSNATPMFSFISIELLLLIAFILLIRIDLSNAPVAEVIEPSKKIPLKRYWIFFVFVFILSINSGLMHQVIYPYFEEHRLLVSLYSNLPFILMVYGLSRSPKTNKLNALYIGLGLWGLTFIAFSLSGPTELGYLIVFTLMLSGSGIFSYFLWSMMTSNFEHVTNPSSFFGMGLSLNVLGVWFGGLIGSSLLEYGIPHQVTSNIGLVLVLLSMVIILPLNQKLSIFIHQNHFMIKFSEVHLKEKKTYLEEVKGLLSEREYEVFSHLIKGETDPTISKLLNISLNTTKTHNRKIYRKLSVSGRSELIQKCN